MGTAHSPSGSHKTREQRAQQAAVMHGYARALRTAYVEEPLPQHMQSLLKQLEERERG
jgi:hypothetical protein